MIGTRHQLFQAILATLAQATPEQKRQLREALCENRCEVCGESRRTFIHDNMPWPVTASKYPIQPRS